MPSAYEHSGRRRVLIVGRGVAGVSLSEDAIQNGDTVVGFLDDRAQSPDVVGTLADVADVVVAQSVDIVYFAIPSAPADVLQRVIRSIPPGIDIAIIPRTYRIVARDRVSVGDLTDVDVLDLVGRAPVKHDMEEARAIMSGRPVLVTGAAGSIGSRILQQLLALDAGPVVGVDRSESGVFHLGQMLQEERSLQLEIGDVQSAPRVVELLERYRPEFVFHVAAYKHVPLMQGHPIEAFNNNVWGSLNVMRSAAQHGVKNVVFVSTDKAVNPTNVMGATKRLGELLLRDLAERYPSTRFNAVRFGNVLESEGSVMQTFRRQLQIGRNLTITHPEITRYFMTIDEAAQLVIRSTTAGRAGDLFVLDMGEPIRLMDLAEGLIAAVNPSLGIDVIGLRPGEKMFEELSYRESDVDLTEHPKIFVVREHHTHDSGETLAWAEAQLAETREYRMSDADLVSRLRAFGFPDLQ